MSNRRLHGLAAAPHASPAAAPRLNRPAATHWRRQSRKTYSTVVVASLWVPAARPWIHAVERTLRKQEPCPGSVQCARGKNRQKSERWNRKMAHGTPSRTRLDPQERPAKSVSPVTVLPPLAPNLRIPEQPLPSRRWGIVDASHLDQQIAGRRARTSRKLRRASQHPLSPRI